MAILSPSRRGFIGGLIGLVAAPAIVRIESLMPVRVIDPLAGLKVFGWNEYGATVWERIPLPVAPLTEGIRPIGEQLLIRAVSSALPSGAEFLATDRWSFS